MVYDVIGGFIRVGNIEDFPLGSLRKVMVGDQAVLVANHQGKLHAISNRCTHRGAPLNEGELDGNALFCPWHGGQFDVRTGAVINPPPMKGLDALDVQIQGSDVFLKKK